MQNRHRNITVIANRIENIQAAAQAGFWGVDLTMAGYLRRDDLFSGKFEKELLEKFHVLQELDLKVGQTHLSTCPAYLESFVDGTFASYRAFLLPMLEREIELTAKLGCHLAVMHPYHAQDKSREECQKGNLALIEDLLPTLEKYGVTLALENVYGPQNGGAYHDSAQDMLFYTEHILSPYLGLCLDTGHACIREQDPVAMALAYGKHLKALHVHGSFFRQDNHAIPATTNGDIVAWQTFCDVLDEIGYEGTFNLEVKPCRSLPKGALPAYYQLAYAVAKNLLQRSLHV